MDGSSEHVIGAFRVQPQWSDCVTACDVPGDPSPSCWFRQMVLDNRTYDQLEGGWRSLFDRLKWDIIKSVVKSVSGLQGKKVKVSQRLGMSQTSRSTPAAALRQDCVVKQTSCRERVDELAEALL